jgi:hypothetical protein
MRSPIRSGELDLNDFYIRIGWPFFGDFFWPPKKSYNGKNEVIGKFQSTEKFLNKHG